MTMTASKTGGGAAAPAAPVGGATDQNWAAVAEALNRQMADCRITQQRLSVRSGVSVSTIRVLQRGTGRRARDTTLAALSRALGRPDDYLLRALLGDQTPAADARQPEATIPPSRSDSLDSLLRLPSSLVDWWNLRHLTDSPVATHIETGTANQLFAVVHLPSPGRPDPTVYVAFESAHAASLFAFDHGLIDHLVAQLLFDTTPAGSHSTACIRRHHAA